MRRVCVYCGSSPGAGEAYVAMAQRLAAALVARGIGLVYGGGSVGLMGAVADAVLAAGGEATGVIPVALNRREIAHPGLSELHVVTSMHERKAKMAELADAFVALPGGLGTLEELVEVATWTQLGIHAKPVGLLDVEGYWSGLEAQLDHAVRERFMSYANRRLVLRDRTPEALLDALAEWAPAAAPKWLRSGGRALEDVGPRGPFVGVSAVVVRDGRVLLARRLGAHGAGTRAFPGGKLDAGETPAGAVARELSEETGLVAREIAPAGVTNDVFLPEGLHYVTLHHRVVADGEPERREPEKAQDWSWHAWDALPVPLFGPAAALSATGWRP